MTRGAWTLGRIRGIPIRLHFTLALVIPFLAAVFAGQYRALGRSTTLLLPPLVWGGLTAISLFGSVLLHELAHSLVAIRTGGKVRGITLMFIGGVSELAGKSPAPRIEAIMAAAGPLASLAIGALLFLLSGAIAGAPPDLRLAIRLVGVLNLVLGAFNLLPAFPLDGGRILRALLQMRMGKLRATRMSAMVGRTLALVLALVAFYVGDILAAVVAAFIFFAAGRELQGAEVEAAISGMSAFDACSFERPLTLSDGLSARAAAERMRAGRTDAAVVVTLDGAIKGAVSAGDLARVPLAARGRVRLADLASGGTVRGGQPLDEVVQRLTEGGTDVVPVVDAFGTLVGVLRRRDVEREMMLRPIVEEPEGAPWAEATRT